MKTFRLEAFSRPTNVRNQFRADIPPSFGQGGIDIISFSSGMNLLLADYQYNQTIHYPGSLKDHSIGFGFCLHGQADCYPVDSGRDFTIKSGTSAFYSIPKGQGCLEKSDSERMFRIILPLDKQLLFQLVDGDEDRFCSILKSLEKKSSTRITQNTTPILKAVLLQLLHCPYNGSTRQIYLEGKSLELIAHMLEQLCPKGGCYYDCPIKSSDADRAHHAAHMLVRDLNNPPDLMEIAQAVGVGRTKLFRSFRQTFGLSPFEYLRNQRLQTAMQLIQDKEMNVTEAALMVGYSNMSYFAKAFKSMFGVVPSELRKSINA